jgi:predicted RNA-binding Zn ribbon-like protein
VAVDAADDDFDDGGDAVSEVEHAATRQILATTMHAFNAAVRAAFLIREFDTRLVKTISGGRASFLGNECGRAFRVGPASNAFDTVAGGNPERKKE